jgi:hypothetical protein
MEEDRDRAIANEDTVERENGVAVFFELVFPFYINEGL